MKTILTLVVILNSLVSFAGQDTTYDYMAVVSVYYPNDSFNTLSLSQQCDGEIISKVNFEKTYSFNAYVGVCKKTATTKADKVEGIFHYQPVIAVQYPNTDHNTKDVKTQCKNLGGELGEVTVYSEKGAFATHFIGAVCRIKIRN